MDIEELQKLIMQESSLSRMIAWNENYDCAFISAFRAKRDCGRGAAYTKQENLKRQRSLLLKLSGKGYGTVSVKGWYHDKKKAKPGKAVRSRMGGRNTNNPNLTKEQKGIAQKKQGDVVGKMKEKYDTAERSYLVINLTDDPSTTFKQTIFKLGKQFEQDSILIMPVGSIKDPSKAYLLRTNSCPNNFMVKDDLFKSAFSKVSLGNLRNVPREKKLKKPERSFFGGKSSRRGSKGKGFFGKRTPQRVKDVWISNKAPERRSYFSRIGGKEFAFESLLGYLLSNFPDQILEHHPPFSRGMQNIFRKKETEKKWEDLDSFHLHGTGKKYESLDEFNYHACGRTDESKHLHDRMKKFLNVTHFEEVTGSPRNSKHSINRQGDPHVLLYLEGAFNGASAAHIVYKEGLYDLRFVGKALPFSGYDYEVLSEHQDLSYEDVEDVFREETLSYLPFEVTNRNVE